MRSRVESGCSRRYHGRVSAIVRVHPGLRQHLRAKDLAGGDVENHKLQCRTGVQQLPSHKGLTLRAGAYNNYLILQCEL